MPVNNLFITIQSDLFPGAKCKVWCTSRLYSRRFILYSIYCKALARHKREKNGNLGRSLFFKKLVLFCIYSTSISQITPYFIVCCKHVYDRNSTKARKSLPKIRIGFYQNTLTGSNNKNVLRKQITGQPIRKIK